ncbi:hypothetical protein ACVIGB_000148 [Bradyrhizobium sp. USDA 4341]
MTKHSNQSAPTIVVSESGTTRAFKMHPALLWDVMTRQAGTLSKAAQEGCQNSVDAGAKSVRMTLTKDRLIIEDDGKGFVDDREIEDFFETFGHPHEEGDAVFGRFRMGRGQLLATGVCKYISNNYRMRTDLRYQKGSKNEGLNYQLYKLDESHKGCRIEIELYEKLIPSKIDEIEREIARNMKYLQIPLELNGEIVNKLPKDCKWDFEDDVAYYSLRDVGSLSVYNLGVFVKDYPATSYGTGGTVVSKVPLDVNFARNDVVSACKVFKKISAKVRSTSVEKSVKKTKLNDNEWESIANAVRVGSKSLAEILDLKLLRNSSGAMFSLADLGAKLGRASDRIAVAKAKDMVADRLLQRGIALVLDEEVLSKFGYGSLKEFKTDIAKKAGKEAKRIHDWKVRNPLLMLEQALGDAKILEGKDFGKYVKADYEEVPIKDLSPAEKFALKVFSRGCNNLGWEISRIYQLGRDLGEETPYPWQRLARERDLAAYPASVCEMMVDMAGGKDATPRARELKVGLSMTAAAWTDGEHTIWINRNRLSDLTKGLSGCAKVASLLLHEYVHQAPNLVDNNHDPEFYELFHNLSVHTPLIGRAVDKMMETAVKLVRDEKRKPTGAFKKFEDQKAQVVDPIFVANDQPEFDLIEEGLAPGLAP